MTTELKFDCVFCKEVFEDKAALLIHFRKHGDPNFSSKNKNRQQNEMANNDKPVEENELVGCDVCEEVFPTISKAITHKHKAHPDHDAKYFCPFCGKLFTMKHLYNKHLQSSHESSEASNTNNFHCDCCDVSFHVPSAMLYHNKFFHRQDTELPAFGQSKKVKTYNQELLQIYYCAFCGEEYNNKVNLHKHIGDDHEDENQTPTEILRCPLCEAIFYHLDAYELHLTFHSTADLYSEKNEMKEQVTEFSLETVSPIIEKVEEEQDEDDQMNTEGIDSFLQLVMGESTDNDNPDKLKSKKHKKHKKSKKAAITLDEFLNMNKDVFGDGLDVQGIEEVPTQVVLKKVKGKKLSNKPEPKTVNANLAKLKKHGIVVKTKSGNNPLVKTTTNKEVNKPNIINTPNEILSKLMNQGNSQIKIVKKNVSQNAAINEDIDNLDTTKIIEKPIKTTTNKDITSDHEEEEIKGASKITSIDENALNEKSEIYTDIQENENSNTNDKILKNEDNNPILEKSQNSNLENKNLSTNDIKSPSNLLEDNNLNVNLSVPKKFCPTPNDTKHELTNDEQTKESVSANNDDDNKEQVENNITNTTLNALKHLSHLITVKPLNQGKNTNISKSNEKLINEKKTLPTTEDKESDLIKNSPIEQKAISLNKSVGEYFTLKPSNQSPKSTSNFYSDAESEDDEINDKRVDTLNIECNKIEYKISNKCITEPKKVKIKNLPVSQDFVLNKDQFENPADDQEKLKSDNCTKKANLDILKRLTNVTAKPISVNTTVNQVSNTNQDKSNNNQIKKNLLNSSCKDSVNEDIEIFNIDDSDSEDNETATFIKNKTEGQSLNVTALRNIDTKSIVVKSKQNIFPNEVKDKHIENKSIKEENIKLNKQSQEIQKSINLQNKLRSLSGNITVKSRNSSPNVYNKELHKSFEDYDDEDETNYSDSESIGKVKISEMPENYDSGNECNESQTSAIIESPHVSNSENEDNDDMEDDFSDFESHIKTNTLKKENTITTSKNNTCLENFKNLNKELTIKSLNTKTCESEGDVNSEQKEISEDTSNVKKQIVVKAAQTNFLQNEQPSKSTQQVSGSVNQSSFKKNLSMANQVNTVKTVKRFQSQTVIEEITTTVTKTIRTVNQSTNEVVQNRCNLKPAIRPQKTFNKQPGRELQGTTVRHGSPTIGTKIRNATNVIRNPTPTIVRPSNQLVLVRPVLNLPSTSAPSTSAVKKVVPPKCSPQKPVTKKLKISPHALTQAIKRPSDETTGHFSCFKKPKESLVNSADMADCEEDSAIQYNMACQSRSDFSSVTKTVKGKGMITATQTRSEVSTSSQQQLSKLSNVSGLKIMKTSSKQATKIEEKCEMNTAKKNTLEALEKLQKQGLLIKKPRVDEYNEHPNSFSESDDEANEK